MNLNFNKYADGLIPAIVQDSETRTVLMLGFMNEEALTLTKETGRVTIYSRSRQELWTKGETSGNFLEVVSITADCDEDTLLIEARPAGPVCHTGHATCFGEENLGEQPTDLLIELESVIDARRREPTDGSHVAGLFAKGINKIAQKVGEEAVELVIEAKDDDIGRFTAEAADLLFHFLVLLRAKNVSSAEVLGELRRRRQS